MTKNESFMEFVKSFTQLRKSFRTTVMVYLKENKIDLTPEMIEVLGFLWQYNDSVNQQTIADSTSKHKANLSGILNNLLRRGFIAKHDNPADQRNKIIVLTVKGTNVIKKIVPWLEEVYVNSVKDISTKDLNVALEVFRKINAQLND